MAESVGSVALDIVVGKDEVTGKLNNFGKVAGGVAKTLGAGLAVASGAVLALGKQAIASYGEYEQLVGGVETLFKDNADAVIGNADRAYKTAGMSANTYMQTVTSFSASLLQSLDGDTKRATEYADMAITDMADNANKMGTSMEMIQNAYQGFAKQNYTMLDNLKLGYGGTKGEMERLLEDASAIAGIEFDISSYADVVEAIHIIQENMGITGTTALEASQTIQGSISAMGGAWQNLLTGLTDPTQNFDELISNFVESVGTVAENLVPRLSNVLNGIVSLVTQLAPVIVTEVPNMVKTILPSLLDGAISIVSAVIEALPSFIGMIVEMLPTLIPLLIDGLVNMFVMLCTNFATIIQPIIDNLPEIIMSIVNGLMDNLPQLIEGLIALTIAIVEAMPEIIMALIECIPQIIVSVVDALIASLPTLLEGVGQMIASVGEIMLSCVTWINTNVIQPVLQFFSNLWENIKGVFSAVGTWFNDTVVQPVIRVFSNAWNGLKNGAVNAWNGIKSVFSTVADFFGNIFGKAWDGVKKVFSTGGKIFDGIKDGIVSAFKAVVNAIIRGINKVVSLPFNGINSVLSTLRGINILGVSPFGWLGSISVPKIPELEQGGVLKKGQVGLLEGKGAEAVVPLEKNTGWLNRIADILNQKIGLGSFATAIERAVSAPALHNVKAGTSFGEQDNSKLNRLIELFERFIAEDNGDMTVPIYIGNELIDEYIVNKNSRQKLRSGGHA